jgi:hypothetical protein
MAQGAVLLGPKKDNATSGGGGRNSRRGGSRGSDGGTSKHKPRRTGNRKQRSDDENDEEDQVVKQTHATTLKGVGASVITGNTGSNGSSSKTLGDSSDSEESCLHDENDPRSTTRKGCTTNETETMVSYGICCTYAWVHCWTNHLLVENYILVPLGRLAWKNP